MLVEAIRFQASPKKSLDGTMWPGILIESVQVPKIKQR